MSSVARNSVRVLLIAALGCSAGGSPPSSGTGGTAGSGPTAGSGGRGGGAGGSTGGSSGSGTGGSSGAASGGAGGSSAGTGGGGGTGGNTGGSGGGATGGSTTADAAAEMAGGSGGAADMSGGGGVDTPAAREIVLVFSRTTGFRHASIPPAVAGLRQALQMNGFTVEATEDPAVFTSPRLSTMAGVILVSTTGKPLGDTPAAALTALEALVRGGGALIGLHAASSTEYEPPVSYTRLIGGRFVEHPGNVRQANCHGEGDHPSVTKIAKPFVVRDEIYVMNNLNPDNQVVLRCEAFGSTANRLPIAWYRNEGQGRVFYTALGHENGDWTLQSPYLRDHALPGILWALGGSRAP